GLDDNLPAILIMGGGQGLGPIKEIVRSLDQLLQQVQLIVVCGINRSLLKWLKKNKSSFSKRLVCVGYTEQIDELMTVSEFIVTKPGGLTSAEALSKSLPIIIVNPLPGQESQNTQFLLEAGVAQQARDTQHLQYLAGQLLSKSGQLDEFRQRANRLAQPNSALKIAQVILERLNKE
ncbi:MAG: galactosyldiacylglycerol synthase, partial [Candidatus Omnitrophica bacterium]|nr:galactosyldiacylglycerol synthase [Candidatus Omnitrophota bacterium]